MHFLFALRQYFVQSWTALALALIGGVALNFTAGSTSIAVALAVGMFLYAERAKNGKNVLFEDIRGILYAASALGLITGLIWNSATGFIVFGTICAAGALVWILIDQMVIRMAKRVLDKKIRELEA